MEIKKVPIAAAIMEKSKQFVRRGLIAGKFPFGTAVKSTGKIYSYYISPKRFMEYTGCPLEDIKRGVRDS